MSNVYNFDDKILHIESLQLKRTDEILNSRDEAVEALLNYCGDDTMDGMPLLARYWADSGQTEIKHVRGYIHNIDGHMGISVDDIVDVEEIYEYIDSAITAATSTINLGNFNTYEEAERAITSYTSNETPDGTRIVATYDKLDQTDTEYNVLVGNVIRNEDTGVSKGYKVNNSNVIYWECKTRYDEELEKAHKKFPFFTRNGAYESAFRELVNPGLYTGGRGGENMERTGDPMLYVTPVHDDRRDHPNTWYGTKPKLGSLRHDYYSVLTMFYNYDRTNSFPEDPSWDVETRGTILDPRRYERKIHEAIHLGGRAQSKNDNYVIKKPLPLMPHSYYVYFYEGAGIPFELPKIPNGCTLNLWLPGCVYPLDYAYMGGSFNNALLRTRRNTFFEKWQNGSIVISFEERGERNLLKITNNTGNYTEHTAITMQYGKDKIPPTHILVKSTGVQNTFRYDDENDSINHFWGKEIPSNAKQVYISLDKIYTIMPNNHDITVDTTSPGFRIENGKIRCYRKSDFERIVKSLKDTKNGGGPVKYVKDGTSFYRHDRNALRCGVGSLTVLKHQKTLENIFWSNYKIREVSEWACKENGDFEFLKANRRGRVSRSSSPTVCHFGVSFLFVDENGRYVMNVNKMKSTSSIAIESIGCAFIGVDGHLHKAKLTGYEIDEIPNETHFPPEAGSYTVRFSYMNALDRDYQIMYPMENGDYSNSLTLTYVNFDFDITEEKYKISYSLFNSNGTTLNYVNHSDIHKSKTKWSPILTPNRRNYPYKSRFVNSYFNTCRYIQKFKGVKSEFPEIFYTR